MKIYCRHCDDYTFQDMRGCFRCRGRNTLVTWGIIAICIGSFIAMVINIWQRHQ